MVYRYEINMTPKGNYLVSTKLGHKIFKSEEEVETYMKEKFKTGELEEAEIWFN